MLHRTMQQQSQQQNGVDFGSTRNGASEFDPDSYGTPQGGLLGRLHALRAEQDGYQPGSGVQAPFVQQNPNFSLPSQTLNGVPLPMARLAAPSPATSVSPQAIQQYEADQAQQAREAAAARLARGVRNLAGVGAAPLDSSDIAKSTGIDVVNGAIGLIGTIPQVSDWAHRSVNKGIDTVSNAVKYVR